MKLRNYQDKGIGMLREQIVAGFLKILLFLATGGGKSVMFSAIVENALKKNKKILLVMRRRNLITQAQANLKKWAIKTSIIMASTKGFNPKCDVQICSIDTIFRRIDQDKYQFLLDFDIVIIDEAHDATSPSYQKFLSYFKDKIIIGFTASPFPIGNKIHDYWDTCVKPIEMHELLEMGYLTDTKIYAPFEIDTTGIRMISGDFDQKQLAKKASEMKIVGDIVKNYKKNGQNKRALLFGVNIAHSMLMAEAFRREGIPALHIDQSHTPEERADAVKKLENDEIKVLCNVNIFSTGVDIPSLELGILARPTMSEVLYIQQVGRLLRPFQICAKCHTSRSGEKECHICKSTEVSYRKKEAIIFDHGGNTGDRHGFPFDVRKAVLRKEDKKKKPKGDVTIIRAKRCPECAYLLGNLSATACPDCGFVFVTQDRKILEEDGELVLITKQRELSIKIEKEFRQSKFYEKKARWKFGTLERRLYKIFGIDLLPHIDKLGLSRKVINEERKKELLCTTSGLAEKSCAGSSKRVFRY